MNIDKFSHTMAKIGIFTGIAMWSALITYFFPAQDTWVWGFMEWIDLPGSLLGIGAVIGYGLHFDQQRAAIN